MFTIRAKPGSGGCKTEIEVSETDRSSSQSGEGGCEQAPGTARVTCQEGRLTITAVTQTSAAQARLLLSNGRSITSQVFRIPASLGAGGGVYHQALRGPSPIPVSLTELAADGSTVGVIRLRRVVECVKVRPIAGGVRTLARGRAPGGPAFKIIGEAARYLGSVHFTVRAQVSTRFYLGESESGSTTTSAGGRTVEGLSVHVVSGCSPHPFAIVFALVKAPGATVFARTSHGMLRMSRAAIPSYMHPGGWLAYGAYRVLPKALQEQDSRGRPLTGRPLGSGRPEESCSTG
jgi:hypothetical protein